MGRPPECNTCCDITGDPPVSDCEFLVAIAFLDENSGSQGKETKINPLTGNTYFFDKYEKYLEAFPNRLVFVLDVFRASDFIYYPPNFLDSDKAFSLKAEFEKDPTNLIQFINKDNNSDAIANANDPWGRVVEIASRYPEAEELLNNATEISIFADDSGSMKERQIAATLRKLKADIAAAGKRTVGSIANGNEDVMCPFVLERCCTGPATTELAALCFTTTRDDRYLYTCCPDDLILSSPLSTQTVLIRNYCDTIFEEGSVYEFVCPDCTSSSDTNFTFQFNVVDDKGTTQDGSLKFYYEFFDNADATWKDLNLGSQNGTSGQPFSLNLIIDQWGGSSSTEEPCHSWLANTNSCESFTDGDPLSNGCLTRTFNQLFRIRAEYVGDENCDPQNFTAFSQPFQLYEWRRPTVIIPDEWTLTFSVGDECGDFNCENGDVPRHPNWGPNIPYRGYPHDCALDEFGIQPTQTPRPEVGEGTEMWYDNLLFLPNFYYNGKDNIGVKNIFVGVDWSDNQNAPDIKFPIWESRFWTPDDVSVIGKGCWTTELLHSQCKVGDNITNYKDPFWDWHTAYNNSSSENVFGTNLVNMYYNRSNYIAKNSNKTYIVSRALSEDEDITCGFYQFVAPSDRPEEEKIPKINVWVRTQGGDGWVDYPIVPNTTVVDKGIFGSPSTINDIGFNSFNWVPLVGGPCFDDNYFAMVGQVDTGTGYKMLGLSAKLNIDLPVTDIGFGKAEANTLFYYTIDRTDDKFTDVYAAAAGNTQSNNGGDPLYSILGTVAKQDRNTGIFRNVLGIYEIPATPCDGADLPLRLVLAWYDEEGFDPEDPSNGLIGSPYNYRTAMSASSRFIRNQFVPRWSIISQSYAHWVIEPFYSKTLLVSATATGRELTTSNDFDTQDEKFNRRGRPILLNSDVNAATWAVIWRRDEVVDPNGFVSKFSYYVKIKEIRPNPADPDEPFVTEYPSLISATFEYPDITGFSQNEAARAASWYTNLTNRFPEEAIWEEILVNFKRISIAWPDKEFQRNSPRKTLQVDTWIHRRL